MRPTTSTIRRVSAAEVAALEAALSAAVEAAIPDALSMQHGLRVMRLGPGEYQVLTDPDVPCGYTVCDT